MTKEDQNGIVTVDSLLSDIPSHWHYGHFLSWRQYHMTTILPFGCLITPRKSLPSTLADIRARQRVDMYADAPMKHIDIHNEGCELKTIEENIHLFRKYRPSLSVAVYHSNDGLYKIEKMLMESLLDYQWKFRLHSYMGQGAYIYGTPNERRK